MVAASCGGASTPEVGAGSSEEPEATQIEDQPTPKPEATNTPVPDPTSTATPDPTSTAIPDPTSTPAPDVTDEPGTELDRASTISFLEDQGFNAEQAACTADAGYELLGTWDMFDVSSDEDARMEAISMACIESGDADDAATDDPAGRAVFLEALSSPNVLVPADAECLADVTFDIFDGYDIPDEVTDRQALEFEARSKDCITAIGGPAEGSPPPGDDAEFDALWTDCTDGDGEACDDLYLLSPAESDYEAFGWTCGGRTVLDNCPDLLGTVGSGDSAESPFVDSTGRFDLDLIPDPGAVPPGDDADLDQLWIECSGEQASSCDELFLESPSNSVYEAFGWTCGGREPSTSCDELFGTTPVGAADLPAEGSPAPGDDAVLDALWTGCSDGDADACFQLFYDAPIDSVYEGWGLSCGGSPTRTLPCEE